jgi:phenylacetic acid degradation operon negative regulatory protein
MKRDSIKRHNRIRARFATVIYTLFGAYIIPRGGEVHVASLIKLVHPLGFSENAVRLGLSRMSKYGVFRVRRAGRMGYYSLNAKGMKLMEQGRVRAFEVKYRPWDGKWRLVTYNIPETRRALRSKLRLKLQSLGFANLSVSLWISPSDFGSEIIDFTEEKDMTRYVETFESEYTGYRKQKELAAAIWGIDELASRYKVFVDEYSNLDSEYARMAKTGKTTDLAAAFAQRFYLTAEYVALRLEDPMLPLELLPKNWVGLKAQRLHDQSWKLLQPAADRFVDSVLKK